MRSLFLLIALSFCGVASAQTVIVVPAQVEAEEMARTGVFCAPPTNVCSN